MRADWELKQLDANLLLAEREEKAAFRVYEPLAADNHLANLAADVLETVTSVPILVRKRPNDAPVLSPAIILSQTTKTEGFGTLDASGEVSVTLLGDPQLDWRVVRLAFEDANCKTTVSPAHIAFQAARWRVPILAEPSKHEVSKWASALVDALIADVEIVEGSQRLVEAGYSNVPTKTGYVGLGAVQDSSLTFDDGSAHGQVKVSLVPAKTSPSSWQADEQGLWSPPSRIDRPDSTRWPEIS